MENNYNYNLEERISMDKFYTNVNIAYDLIKEYIKDKDYSKYLFIEPSAGNGSLMEVMDKLNLKYKAFDLYPEHKNIIKQDFLNFNISDYTKRKSNIITFMNPPFGFACNLAIKFFNKASEFSQEIWLIAPKTFKKNSVKQKLNKYFKMIYCIDLPKNSFILNNEPYDVPCCLSIWIKTKEVQNYNVKKTSDLFSFTTKELGNIAVRRVGGRTGQVLEGLDYSTSTTYFIKIDKDYDNVLKAFKNIDLTIINDTVGVRSISKSELIELVENEYYKIKGGK